MNILADTNIFLEIILAQEKKNICKKYLEKNKNKIAVSDFSVHSIGIYLFREKKHEAFLKFAKDILVNIPVLTIPKPGYENLTARSNKYNLDFDDTHQAAIALNFNLQIATMDLDFKKIGDKIKVVFL